MVLLGALFLKYLIMEKFWHVWRSRELQQAMTLSPASTASKLGITPPPSLLRFCSKPHIPNCIHLGILIWVNNMEGYCQEASFDTLPCQETEKRAQSEPALRRPGSFSPAAPMDPGVEDCLQPKKDQEWEEGLCVPVPPESLAPWKGWRRKKAGRMDWQNALAHEGTCHQLWWPEFDS